MCVGGGHPETMGSSESDAFEEAYARCERSDQVLFRRLLWPGIRRGQMVCDVMVADTDFDMSMEEHNE